VPDQDQQTDAGEQTCLMKQQHREGDQQRRDQQRLDVFGQAVGNLGRAGHALGCRRGMAAV